MIIVTKNKISLEIQDDQLDDFEVLGYKKVKNDVKTLEEMTAGELKLYAKDKGIDIEGLKSKAEIFEVVQKFESENQGSNVPAGDQE